MFYVYGLLIDFVLKKCLDFQQDREILTIDYNNFLKYFSSVTKDENKQERMNGRELLCYLQLDVLDQKTRQIFLITGM